MTSYKSGSTLYKNNYSFLPKIQSWWRLGKKSFFFLVNHDHNLLKVQNIAPIFLVSMNLVTRRLKIVPQHQTRLRQLGEFHQQL